MNNPRIVYMGTPEFAVAGLRALLDSGYTVSGVVTVPDKPAGRGRKLAISPIKEFALSRDIPLAQPDRLRDPSFLEQLKAWNADIQVVVAFRMLPKAVWSLPPLGTFNLHASLLPLFRGAAPINWALIHGESYTGVTTFLIDDQIDTGDILLAERTPITDQDDAGTLHDRLMNLGADLIVKTVQGLWDGSLVPGAQRVAPDLELPAAPKIFREDCRIEWTGNVRGIFNFVRGLSPYPGAWTELVTEQPPLLVKIYRVRPFRVVHSLDPGTLTWSDGDLAVAASDGVVILEEIQLPGRKRLPVKEVLKGWKAPDSGRFA